MQLSDKERRILSIIQIQAHAPVSVIARETGFNQRTIRYCIRSLLERKILTVVPLINYRAFGFRLYYFHFSLNCSDKVRNQLIKALIACPRINHFLEVAGSFRYSCGVLARDWEDFTSLLERFNDVHGAIFSFKEASESGDRYFYGRRYLLSGEFSKPLYEVSTSVLELEDVDHRILRALSEHSNSSHSVLARTINLSHSTFGYRLKRLEQAKIISGYYYDALLEGIMLNVLVGTLCLKSKNTGQVFNKALLSFCLRQPNLKDLIFLRGAYDYQFGLEGEDHAHLIEAMRQFDSFFGQQIICQDFHQGLHVFKISSYPFKSIRDLHGKAADCLVC